MNLQQVESPRWLHTHADGRTEETDEACPFCVPANEAAQRLEQRPVCKGCGEFIDSDAFGEQTAGCHHPCGDAAALAAQIRGQVEEGKRKGFDFGKQSFFTRILRGRVASWERMTGRKFPVTW